MCGIALILSGVRIVGSDLRREVIEEGHEQPLLLDDLKTVLQRRGPDSLGFRKVFLLSKCTKSKEKKDSEEEGCLQIKDNVKRACIISSVDPVGAHDIVGTIENRCDAEVEFLGATLQLRGISPVVQPLMDNLGNILVYNGEIFGGIDVSTNGNDSEALLDSLRRSCSGCHGLERACGSDGSSVKSIPEILSTIRGPGALIYWQEKTKTIWFGRDAFGRRSLLVHWPTVDDPRFILSSLSPPSVGSVLATDCFDNGADSGVAHTEGKYYNWEELPCGIFSIRLQSSESNEHFVKEKLTGEIIKHEWTDASLNELIKWERTFVDPKLEELSLDSLRNETKLLADTICIGSLTNYSAKSGCMLSAVKVLNALRESVKRRTSINFNFETSLIRSREEEQVPIALLFSGGLDSMILAALLDQCLDSRCTIDLLNVSFDGQLAPDRVSARLGVKELQEVAPLRRWRLVEIDATLSNLTWETKNLMSLIHPSKTYMDLNIGIALWLAASGDGWVDGEICNHLKEGCHRYKYKSVSRVLFVGSGADEQCAGYGRHKTKYRTGGWMALQEEMRLDMQRIWKRNLGRDDRCISDCGKEARFPFLDEEVIKTLLDIPLWEIAELDEPSGKGDKKILREVARLLGLKGAASMPKRAIQFGSRVARESNRRNFGSNRAANQASAGSVEVCEKIKFR
ncbi:asparagine synthetase domain-containing protein 1-like isoform X1 [Iris pallida]|uniref:Asparagine synthetase domain-containing protein 1-like isoform X1 n=1 Tax=Iris pallida TaxID=29817 RepID=A0AAX6HUS6_IRIPA|nr:asparagine synthetase domain-containing protein 1-like isoform X1 [Iris pallida]